MDEREAITKIRHGDIDGLEPLVRSYQHRAVRAAYLITRNREHAEDIVQAAFIRAFERIGQLQADRSFGPWFLQSVVNDAVKATNRGKRHVSLDAENNSQALAGMLADPTPGPDELFEGIETREELWLALDALPGPQQVAIVLRYYLGLTDSEMAEVVSRPIGTVKWRLHTAHRRLYQVLSAPPGTVVLRALKERSKR